MENKTLIAFWGGMVIANIYIVDGNFKLAILWFAHSVIIFLIDLIFGKQND